MILEMDFGNTRIKWRLRNAQEIILRDAFERDKGLDQLAGQLQDYISRIHAVWVASVLDDNAKAWIEMWAKENLNLQPVFAQSEYYVAGVTNGYDEPRRLGVDRWLAIIAAHHYCHSACIVISCGTAMTVDLLDAKGMHLGGYIAPGWRTALLSLNQHTQLIRLPEVKSAGLHPGRYTQAAVDCGLTACYVGLIQNAITQLKTQTDQDSIVILATGGDAAQLSSYFPNFILREELILDGLAYCLN